jgi:hypothetical protein
MKAKEYCWLHRDINNDMYLGPIKLNSVEDALEYEFRWKLTNRRASKREIRFEYRAILHNGKGFKVDEEYYRNHAKLYVPLD